MSPALLSPADVADRLGVSVRSARIYMARMRHRVDPMVHTAHGIHEERFES